MDQHPIPQDVTGFQFKLIGTMTVKQFGYVACGVVSAVVLYYLPLHSALGILLKVFLIPTFGASGAIIAFVPIDGRPIDVMTSNFIKALFSPNQYVYHREGRKLSFTTITVAKAPSAQKAQQTATIAQNQTHHSSHQLDEKEEKLRALLLNSRGRTENDIDKKETAFLKALTIPSAPASSPSPLPKPAPFAAVKPPSQPHIISATPQPKIAPLPMATKAPNDKENELEKKESELEQALSQAKQEDLSSKTPAIHTAAQQKITTLTNQIQEVHAQKEQLEKELSVLQTQLASQKNTPTPIVPQKPVQDPQHVRAIPQGSSQKIGLPHVSDSPNVVLGIVKDSRGNILPNILVEVKDKDGNPVRAFKTNQLGQFASATPLSPGTYTLELEDPKKQHQFDVIQVTANNQILLPIEVISHDAREELRKQLFAS